MLRVAVVDDHLIVREGVSKILSANPNFVVVGAFEDLTGFLAVVAQLLPDVVVTDIRMPPTWRDEGLQLAAQLRREFPTTGVVVLSQYAEPEYALALLEPEAGGRAYLLKERLADAGELINAVTTVSAGGSVIDAKVIDGLLRSRRLDRDSPVARLTSREREVLEKVAQGLSNAGVAGELFLSERAVEKHINMIFSKFGLAEERDVNRRVTATLVYLTSEQSR